jgi:hypothetical protein
MEQNDASSRNVLNIAHHAIEVKIRLFAVVISVFSDFKTCIGKDGVMVPPGGIRDIDVFMSLLSHKLSKDAKATRSRECLYSMNAVFLKRNRILTVYKFECQIYKLWLSSLNRTESAQNKKSDTMGVGFHNSNRER